MLSYFLRTRCCWRSQSCCWSCLHVAVLKLDVAGQDAGQLGVVSVVVEEFLLNNGLPYYVDLVGFSHDCWDVEMTTDVLKKCLLIMLLKIAILKVAQIQFDVVADQVVDT